MKFLAVLILLFPLFVAAQPSKRITSTAITGDVFRFENLPSKQVASRNVDVWLPPGYSPKKKYAVLYMHDGQMLFDAKSTWNKQEWNIDETMTRLIEEKVIRPAIVVGIWNTPQRREEFMPQKAFAMATSEQRKEAATFGITEVFSDKYLKFLVEELKPFIDKTYSVRTDRKNTFVMGSSMGGLISLYAISEYPLVFGGAACVSTHFPAGNGVMIDYMRTSLPDPKNHRIYFDYGTKTLDENYEPFQLKADEVMTKRGFVAGKNWITRKFEGDDHSETSWSKRAAIPLKFLLGE